MKNYREMKKQHQEELNKFEGIFWAFDNRQFAEGMAKIGLKPEETKQILSIGRGGYMLKTRFADFDEMLARHKAEMKQMRKDSKILLEALVIELKNHEYCITYDTKDALNALNLTADQVDKKLLSKAIKLTLNVA